MSISDLVAVLCMVGAVIAPVIGMLVLWRNRSISRFQRILFGLLFGGLSSLVLYFIALNLVFKDGMGP